MTLLYTLCAFAICHTIMFLTFQKRNPEVVEGLRLWFAMKFYKVKLDNKQAEATAEQVKLQPAAESNRPVQKHPTPEEIKKQIEKEIREANEAKTISLHVGDRYFCQLNKNEMEEIGTYAAWRSTNSFIAEVPSDGGTLTARHIGDCDIESGQEGDCHIIYKVKVNETNPDWFASDIFRLLAMHETEMNAIRMLANERWTYYMDRTDKGIAIYTGNERVIRIKYQYDSKGRLKRVLYEINPSSRVMEEIENQMDERMERISTNEKGTRYWYYTRDEVQEFTNCVAFAKLSHFGTILLGIGRNWRDGCSENEVKQNAVMIEATFKDLTDPKDHPLVIGRELATKKDEQPEQKPKKEETHSAKGTEDRKENKYFSSEWEQLKKEQEEADELQKKIEERKRLNEMRKELEERKKKQQAELDLLDGKAPEPQTQPETKETEAAKEPEATTPEDELIRQREQLESDRMELRRKKELFEEQKKLAEEFRKYHQDAQQLNKEMQELQNQLSMGMAGIAATPTPPAQQETEKQEQNADVTDKEQPKESTATEQEHTEPAATPEQKAEEETPATTSDDKPAEPSEPSTPSATQDDQPANNENGQATAENKPDGTSSDNATGTESGNAKEAESTDSDGFNPENEGAFDDLMNENANREIEQPVATEQIEDQIDPTEANDDKQNIEYE